MALSMATIKQIEKQLATSDKKMASIEKRISMYRDRLDKAIAAINKAGAGIAVSDIELVETRNGRFVFREYHLPREIVERYGFELAYRVTSNRESLDRAERDLTLEIRHRDSLSEQIQKMKVAKDAYEQATQGLAQALELAMVDFRVVWFEQMRNWYMSHYNFIREKLPVAQDRYKRVSTVMEYFTYKRGFICFQKSRIYRFLTGIRKRAAEIISDDAVRMDLTTYMAKIEKELTGSWSKGIAILTEKCQKFGLDESSIRVDVPRMTSKGFSALITDGGSRVVDVRVIWAAEYSELVTPHTRYIATQRRMQ